MIPSFIQSLCFLFFVSEFIIPTISAQSDGANCNADEFSCLNYVGQLACLPNSWKCDGKQDCLSLEDEQNCTITPIQCASDEFRCAHRHMCVEDTFLCDGNRDCLDSSDEMDCDLYKTCNPTTSFMCSTGEFCIPKERKCDGVPDCPNRSDELNCPFYRKVGRLTCSPKSFACRSGLECVSRRYQCDGEADCADGSDEQGSVCEMKRRCQPGDKICGNGICKPERLFCDKEVDCTDGSDESNCPVDAEKGSSCPTAYYSCDKNGDLCIPFHHLCSTPDAVNDCVERSVCRQNLRFCTVSTDPNCRCRRAYNNNTICYCPSGFRPINGICVDFDECKQVPGICAQKCMNLPGSYSCTCHSGYELYAAPGESVPSRCRARGSNALLLLSNRAEIRQFDLVTNRYRRLASNLSNDVVVDYWYKNETIIWSDSTNGQLIACTTTRMDDGLLKPLDNCVDRITTNVKEKTASFKGMAFDWIHGLLFWTESDSSSVIIVYNLVDVHYRVLIDTSINEPGAIVVDPSVGLIFWTDVGMVPRIERAGTDGEDRRQIITQEQPLLRWPTALTIDIVDRRIYWADVKAKAVVSANYYGEDVRVVMHSYTELGHPFSMSIFEDRLYLSDIDREGILVMNKFDGSQMNVLLNGLPGPTSVRVFHDQLQLDQRNWCANHTCDHLCLPKARIRAITLKKELPNDDLPQFQCLCSIGYKLDETNRNKCTPTDDSTDLTEKIPRPVPNSRLKRRTSILKTLAFMIIIGLLIGGFVYMRRMARQPRYTRTAVQFENLAFEAS
ncbi:EGF-like domain-containing protein [Aphelenchoides besseyi]|nr:EGF-like domain-containing protein [Aphelenchoides besseyi]